MTSLRAIITTVTLRPQITERPNTQVSGVHYKHTKNNIIKTLEEVEEENSSNISNNFHHRIGITWRRHFLCKERRKVIEFIRGLSRSIFSLLSFSIIASISPSCREWIVVEWKCASWETFLILVVYGTSRKYKVFYFFLHKIQ